LSAGEPASDGGGARRSDAHRARPHGASSPAHDRRGVPRPGAAGRAGDWGTSSGASATRRASASSSLSRRSSWLPLADRGYVSKSGLTILPRSVGRAAL